METILSLGSIEQFLSYLSVNGLAKNTVKAYRADLRVAMDEIPVPEPIVYGTEQAQELHLVSLTRSQVESCLATYLTEMRESREYSPATINRKLACFRKYGKWCGWPDFLSAYRKMPDPPQVAHPLEDGVEAVKAMLKCARKPHHVALVTLTGLLGLRISEALSIRASHINESTDPIMLRFQGKGEKVRQVPVNDKVYELLLPRLVRCWSSNERLVPLSDRGGRLAITSIAKRAGINAVASHDMRMTFGTAVYYNSGGDLRATQELLGHADARTTQLYTFVSMEKQRAAAAII